MIRVQETAQLWLTLCGRLCLLEAVTVEAIPAGPRDSIVSLQFHWEDTMNHAPAWVLISTLALVSARPVLGQVLYGTLDGTVTDTSGAAIAGAKVTARNSGTNQVRQAITGDTGGYSIPNLDPGVYDVTAAKEGFQTFRTTGVRVAVNTAVRADAVLNVGAATESIIVAASAATLQTERADVRFEMDRKALEDLPVPIGRNFQGLLRVLPGFSVSGGGAIRASNPAASFTMNVNGTSAQVNNTRIDGTSSANNFIQSLVAYVPTLESIQTVDATTNSFDAEIGMAGGAAIHVHIKSGTNEFHGSLFEYHTNNAIKARPMFFPVRDRKPKFIFNQTGGSLGGPIVRNRLFFFTSYEYTGDYRAYSRFATVPTLAARTGVMTESTFPIFDPLTGDSTGAGRQAFPGSTVPASRHSAISRKLIPLWPAPNQAGLANNFFTSASSPYNRHTTDAKINWNAMDRLSVFGRLGLNRWSQYYPTVFGPLGGPTLSGQQSGTGDGGVDSLTVAANYTFSPAFLVDGYAGYNRSVQNAIPDRLEENLGRDFLGIPGTNGTRRFEGGWPRMLINGYDNIGINEPFMPWIRNDPAWQAVGNANWIRGRHNLRFGADHARRALNHQQPEIESQLGGGAGGFSFTTGITEMRGGPGNNRVNAMAAFLLGLPQSNGITLQVPDQFTLRSSFYSFYVRDRWDVTSRLTLSYGLRWELYPFPTRADRGAEYYDPDANQVWICGVAGIPRDCGVSVTKAGLGPRLGAAWRLGTDLVVRAGYGITSDPFDIGPRGVRTNYPVVIGVVNTGANAFTTAGPWERGIPPVAVPDFSRGRLPVPPAAVIHAFPSKITRGYIQSWNLSLQKKLAWGFVGQAGYVANRTIRQYGNIDNNAGQVIGAGVSGQPLRARFGRTAPTTEFRPLATAKYDSLQATLDKRFSGGFQMSAAYTWSKAIGNVGSSEAVPRVQALSYFFLNRTVQDYDRTQVLNVTGIWELPFGKGKRWMNQSRLASALLGGWQLNGIFNAMTGLPFSVSATGTSLDMPGSAQRADLVAPAVRILGGTGRGTPFFDGSAFAPVTAQRFGSAGYNLLRGPGLVNADLSLFRDIAAGERVRVQIRADAFNATNTPHWSNPGGNVNSVVRNPDGSVRDLGGFSEITSVNAANLARAGADERVLRFGIRVSF